MIDYIIALIDTIIIELIIIRIHGIKDKRLYFSILFNAITNPLVNAIIYLCSSSLIGFTLSVIISELLVIVVEFILYQLIKKDRFNLSLSFVANLSSLSFGSIIHFFIRRLF